MIPAGWKLKQAPNSATDNRDLTGMVFTLGLRTAEVAPRQGVMLEWLV
jgi:hypothetical protein